MPVRYSPGNNPATDPQHVDVAWLTRPRPRMTFHGREYIMEEAVTGDFALVRAWRADADGNLCFRGVRDFNAVMCKAARVTIALVDEVVPAGEIAAESVHVSGIYVDRVVIAKTRRTGRDRTTKEPTSTSESVLGATPAAVERQRIARRVAVEMGHNAYVNVGPGLPTAALALVPHGVKVMAVDERGAVRGAGGRDGGTDVAQSKLIMSYVTR